MEMIANFRTGLGTGLRAQHKNKQIIKTDLLAY